MQYIEEILRLLTWPVSILFSLFAAQIVLKKVEKYLPSKDED